MSSLSFKIIHFLTLITTRSQKSWSWSNCSNCCTSRFDESLPSSSWLLNFGNDLKETFFLNKTYRLVFYIKMASPLLSWHSLAAMKKGHTNKIMKINWNILPKPTGLILIFLFFMVKRTDTPCWWNEKKL
jgi:hypothetical protein